MRLTKAGKRQNFRNRRLISRRIWLKSSNLEFKSLDYKPSYLQPKLS
jgi:hypothetical protein